MASVSAAQVALIIDDIGYRQTDKAVLSLPSGVTLSVLPHTPIGAELARQAHAKGHEIMMHLPMQALNGKKLGPGGLTNQQDETQIKQEVTSALASIPFVKGVNNHMGSLLTQIEQSMNWVMQALKQHQLYFVDSITTKYSTAGKQADIIGVPMLKRQLFLDNDTKEAALEQQFRLMITKAHQGGHLVAIAHPYPETIKFLTENLPRLEQEGINLVPPSALLPYQLPKKQKLSPEVQL
ncbi:MAG: divergent polysaccharide deacetylase family protein [Shewanella sp.]|nr:divergent polysaccharide deacetylase family protein [Shewanella sp.]MCF1431822.1 divergent polysaccharide deacetylase family protein [Shewanella sp.]MCF1438852.1 divergent polysaccharide deacetylase family protein [Shewanella sp.]MCF1458835.1 divergent polysaccharide deacetylase family protein [Shewanella sp.]